MKAICVTPDRNLTVRDVSEPGAPPPEHVVLEMEACGINPGDKFFLNPPGGRLPPRSNQDVWGASGAGKIIAVGAGVPAEWVGRHAAVYRSLSQSEHTLGLWSVRALMPKSTIALIPDGLAARDYGGSLVNVITAYAFAKQAEAEGHRGILLTAGSSATGTALVGIARSLGLPTVAIVRDEAGRKKLSALGADDIVAQSDASFDADLEAMVGRRSATAVFDGVGGALLTRLVPRLAQASTIYSYGYLGGRDVPLQIPTMMLMAKSLTIRSFSNFGSPTVRDPQKLDAALHHISELLALPHCKTPIGRTFTFEQIDQAMALVGDGAGKPLLVPG